MSLEWEANGAHRMKRREIHRASLLERKYLLLKLSKEPMPFKQVGGVYANLGTTNGYLNNASF